MNTPEFLVWAIEFSCAVRGFQEGRDPERVERQLRVARAVSDAEREGRVYEGVAVLGEEGFRIEAAMEVYGGLGAVTAACGNCPANVLSREGRRVLAGCYGMVVCPGGSEGFQAAVDAAIEAARGDENGRRDACTTTEDRRDAYPTTKLGWYGLWMESPLFGERAAVVARILETVLQREGSGSIGLKELAWALRAAADGGLRVHVAVYPEGWVDGVWFVLAVHCPKCKRTWGEAGPAAGDVIRRADGGQSPPYGKCAACGYEGKSAPVKKRRARGRRPYFPLARLLGEEGAREFFARMKDEG